MKMGAKGEKGAKSRTARWIGAGAAVLAITMAGVWVAGCSNQTSMRSTDQGQAAAEQQEKDGPSAVSPYAQPVPRKYANIEHYRSKLGTPRNAASFASSSEAELDSRALSRKGTASTFEESLADRSVAAQRPRGPVQVGSDALVAQPSAGSAIDGVGANVPRERRPPFVLAPGEELWVIAKPGGEAAAAPSPEGQADEEPGCGALMCRRPGAPEDQPLAQVMVPVPLRHTDVKANVAGYIGSVSVTQKFQNPFSEKIEAVYVFPLPQNAAVDGFLMTIGDRTIRGIIREREEAEQIYREARARGHVASLLTQERPNIFTQKVANIEPGKEIDVEITYFHTLRYTDGWWEWTFPMVVGPRYNPAGWSDPVLASPRGPANVSGTTDVQYLRPSERSGHDIALQVAIDAGMEIQDIACRSHKIEVEREGGSRALVRLAAADTIPNKDFVLRYKVADDSVQTGAIAYEDERGGYFSLMLVPPAELASVRRAPVEVVFVLDCSGSMRGRPIEQSRNAMRRALMSMNENDTFQIVRFSDDASVFGPRPVPATRENIQRAVHYVDALHASGGTQMMRGIHAALDFPHDPERLRFVVFLTDGYIGNESQILAAVQDRIGASRIFSFGVGSSPNRYLLDRMAMLGRGVVGYLGLNDSASDVMDGFFQRVSHPALTDVSIDLDGYSSVAEAEVYPCTARDLFVGRPVIITGRVDGGLPESIRVHGRMNGKEWSIEVPVAAAQSSEDKALASIWARTKIADLMDEMAWTGDGTIAGRVEQLALSYGLMSRFTAFVAVDSLTVTEGSYGVTVAQPVPVPEGVPYETTVR